MPTTLEDSLQQHTWRELRATAHAHGLRFNTNFSKCVARTRLYQELQDGQLRRSFRALSLQDRAALAALQAADGALPLHVFTGAFGAIRPYKPWRDDAPRHPWRRPVSSAEKLWFLGFVQVEKSQNGRPPVVRASADVLALMPPLPRPHPRRAHLPRPRLSPDVLRVDIAALLGTLLAEPVRPRWGRWLPPWALKAINARLRVKEDVATIRSELHTGRTRLLHYLAEVAGLINIQGGVILPTPAAWTWPDLSPDQQWRALLDAWTRDLASRDPLWRTYRFPAISFRVWDALITLLRDLAPRRTYTLRALMDALCPYAPGDDTLDAVPGLLHGPVAWTGIVGVQSERFMLTEAGHAALCENADAFSALENATVTPAHDALWITLPESPRLRPLAELNAWVKVDGKLCVDAAAVARAVEQGYDATGIAQVLADLAGAPLPRDVFEQIARWTQQAQRFVLRQLTVLTSPDASLLAGLRHDRRLRPMFVETLGAHHVAIQPHAAAALRQSLVRRGYPVASLQPLPKSGTPAGDLAPDLVAYLWLAVRVYRHLSAFVDLPVHIPAAIEDWLAIPLPDGQSDALAQTAAAVHSDLARVIDGNASLSAPYMQDDPGAIGAAVEAAFTARNALTVEYLMVK